MLPTTVALPEELWVGIFSQLDRKQDKPAILSLRRVNKTFCRLTTPLVFCRLTPIPTPLKLHLAKSPKRFTVRPWIARIAQQPGLLPLIKEIDLRGRDDGSSHIPAEDMVERELFPAHEQLLAMIKAPVTLSQDLQSTIDEAWTNREAKYRMTTLLLCEAVEEIGLNMAGGSENHLTYRVVKLLARAHLDALCQAAPVFLPLAHVTTVRCEANFVCPVAFDFALQWLSLPRLRSLKICGLSDQEIGNQEIGNQVMRPTLDQDIQHSGPIELHFDDCMLGHEGLRDIIDACTGPISLTMRWRAGLWTERIQWDEIGALLRQYGTRLDHVLIDATPSWSEGRRDTECSFGDLSNTRIRSLGIPYASLINAISEEKTAASLLPTTLERLTLLGAEEGDRKRLFGSHLKTARPRLTDVRVAPWYRYCYEEWFGRVTHQCIDYNVVTDLGLQRAYSG
jgi:hypothetical protein